MNRSDETDLWVTLLAVSSSQAIRDGGLSFSLKSSRQPQDYFRLMAATLLRAQERGLTSLFKVIRSPEGDIQEIVFDRILTTAGASYLEHPGPKVELSTETRALLKSCLRGVPLPTQPKGIDTGESVARVPRIANYTVADQLRDTTRDLCEGERASLGASRFLPLQGSD